MKHKGTAEFLKDVDLCEKGGATAMRSWFGVWNSETIWHFSGMYDNVLEKA